MIQDMTKVLMFEDKKTGKLTPIEGTLTHHKDGTISVHISNWD